MPAIRANTTICLGNVAGYLAEATAKRVLLNAFTRALRDQFPPARMAGLMAGRHQGISHTRHVRSSYRARLLTCCGGITWNKPLSVCGIR